MITKEQIERRQTIERAIVTELLKVLLNVGFFISINNGGDRDEGPPSNILDSILALMFTTDSETLIIHQKKPSGELLSVGWVELVYGNGTGYEVISDYTMNLDKYISPMHYEPESSEEEATAGEVD